MRTYIILLVAMAIAGQNGVYIDPSIWVFVIAIAVIGVVLIFVENYKAHQERENELVRNFLRQSKEEEKQ